MGKHTLWTVGHSNHEIARFVEMLQSVSIQLVADVRRFPGSKRWPQYSSEALEKSLGENGIAYQHFPGLGGRRSRNSDDSPNTVWRVESFNAYADHTATEEFRTALGQLEELARARRTAIMCAEAVPWRCHRRIIADVLIVRGWTVLDIFTPKRTEQRALTDFAHPTGDGVTYPGGTLF